MRSHALPHRLCHQFSGIVAFSQRHFLAYTYVWTGRDDPINLSAAQHGRYLTFDPAAVAGYSAALCAKEYQTAGSTP